MKRKLAILLAATMSMSLVACGSGEKSTAETTAAATTAAPAASETKAEVKEETTAAEATDELSAHLEYWCSWGETESQALVLQAAAEEFTKLNPGVSINFTFNGRDNRFLVTSAIEAGTEVDMMDANWDNCTALWSDYLADLTEYYDEVYPTTNGQKYVDSVLTAYSSLIANDCGGEYRGVAYIPQSVMVFCNKDIFEACGITEYPATWDELMEDCRIIKEAGYIPATCDVERQFTWFGYYLQRLIGAEAAEALAYDSSLWKEGSQYYDAIVEAATAVHYMVEQGYFDPNIASNVSPTAQQNMVINENIAMFISGTWTPNETAATNDEFNWGSFAFPAVEGGIDGTEATCYGTYAMCVNKDCTEEQKRAAFEFAVFCTTGVYDEMFRDKTQSIPMGLDAEWPDALKEAKEVLNKTTTRYAPHLNLRKNADSQPIIGDACTKLYSGEYTVEEFIAAASKF